MVLLMSQVETLHLPGLFTSCILNVTPPTFPLSISIPDFLPLAVKFCFGLDIADVLVVLFLLLWV